jgi:hypothetical protein
MEGFVHVSQSSYGPDLLAPINLLYCGQNKAGFYRAELGEVLDVAHSEDMQARIERLRMAIDSLTHPRDLAVAQKYMRELENEAEKKRGKNHRPRLS